MANAADLSDEETLATGARFAGRYRIERRIGSGGMGTVYAAVDEQHGREVALKVLARRFSDDARLVERFRREARMSSQARHPSIVEVIELGQSDGRWYLAMELLEGVDLFEAIKLKRTYDPLEMMPVLDPVLAALEHAHGLGLVHRDLKPENVFLSRQRSGEIAVKLLDFGVVKVPDGGAQSHLTRTGTVVGTPEYMAPEQAMDAVVDGRADLYALGCVAYKMLCGQPPFVNKSVLLVLNAHVVEPPVPPSVRRPGLPGGPLVDAFVLRALAKRPEDRFQSAGQMRQALAELAFALGDARSTLSPITLPVDRTQPDERGRTLRDAPPAMKPADPSSPLVSSPARVSRLGVIVAAVVGAVLAAAAAWLLVR